MSSKNVEAVTASVVLSTHDGPYESPVHDVLITCPTNQTNYPTTNAPIIYVPKNISVGHPFHRPFDKFFREGNHNIGKVTFILLKTETHQFPFVIGAVAHTRPPGVLSAWSGRVLLFPGWGDDVVDLRTSNGTQVSNSSPIHHATVDITGYNQGSLHMSAPLESYAKAVIWPAASLEIKGRNGLHIGALLLQSPCVLDTSGICKIELDRLPRKDPAEVERIMQQALSPLHPILTLHDDTKWDDGPLVAEIIISEGQLKDEDYPKIFPRQNELENITKISLGHNEPNVVISLMVDKRITMDRSIQFRVKRKNWLNMANVKKRHAS